MSTDDAGPTPPPDSPGRRGKITFTIVGDLAAEVEKVAAKAIIAPALLPVFAKARAQAQQDAMRPWLESMRPMFEQMSKPGYWAKQAQQERAGARDALARAHAAHRGGPERRPTTHTRTTRRRQSASKSPPGESSGDEPPDGLPPSVGRVAGSGASPFQAAWLCAIDLLSMSHEFEVLADHARIRSAWLDPREWGEAA